MLLPSTRIDMANMQHALLINYLPLPRWIRGFFHEKITVTFVGKYSTTSKVVRGQAQDYGTWMHIQPPSPGQIGAQHVKKLTVYYPDRLRLCILSGNMATIEWCDVENVAYVQAFRRLPTGNADITSDAYMQLSTLFISLGLTQQLDPGFADLKNYDLVSFGGKPGARLIISMPCIYRKSFQGWLTIEQNGLGRLKRIVDDMGLEAVRGGLRVCAQLRWMHQLHVIASGLFQELVPLSIKNWRVPLDKALQQPQSSPENTNISSSSPPSSDWPPVRILYPTFPPRRRPAVLQATSVEVHLLVFRSTSLREVTGYSCTNPPSQRGANVLIHAKVILALPPGKRFAGGSGRRLDEPSQSAQKSKGKSKAETFVGWLYMGSHIVTFFTAAAWGHLGGNDAAPTLSSITKHELGIVFPIRESDLAAGVKSLARDALVFITPTEPYGPQDEIHTTIPSTT